MIKQRSLTDSALSDYYFAVTPISIHFDRQYKTRFHFYFEKNLQIISKYQSPVEQVQKNQTVHFAPPTQMQYFRIPNEKSMDYQWSLYIFRVDIQGDNEQLVQVQKITLKDEWSAFKTNKVTVYEKDLKFNSIRCKLSYLIVISANSQELLDNVQRYFGQSKISVLTTDERVMKGEVQLQKQEARREGNNQQQFRAQAAKQQIKNTNANLQQIKISEIIHRGRHSLQSQMNLIDHRNQVSQQLLNIKQEQNIKLSNSQLQIGEQIEQKVNEKQNSHKGTMILQPEQPPAKKTLQPQQKSIRMTSSQMLNQKKEVIVTPHQQKKSILALILVVVLMVASGIWMVGNNGPKSGQKGRRRRQANAKRQARQAVVKKNRGKK